MLKHNIEGKENGEGIARGEMEENQPRSDRVEEVDGLVLSSSKYLFNVEPTQLFTVIPTRVLMNNIELW